MRTGSSSSRRPHAQRASCPQAGDVAISDFTGVPAAGAARYYQAWYRDPASFCTSTTFNLTNALTVIWAP